MFGGHNVMFGSMDVIFTLIASGSVRGRALCLAAASTFNGRVASLFWPTLYTDAEYSGRNEASLRPNVSLILVLN